MLLHMAGEAAAQGGIELEPVVAHGHELGHVPEFFGGKRLCVLDNKVVVVVVVMQQRLPPATLIYGKRDAPGAVEMDRRCARYSFSPSIRAVPLFPDRPWRKVFRSRFESRM